jgi:pimeloyl-ACP methyl ester carboxylesterase
MTARFLLVGPARINPPTRRRGGGSFALAVLRPCRTMVPKNSEPKTEPQSGMDSAIAELPRNVPLLQRTVLFPGCGHWTQQERPNELNAAPLGFLNAID